LTHVSHSTSLKPWLNCGDDFKLMYMVGVKVLRCPSARVGACVSARQPSATSPPRTAQHPPPSAPALALASTTSSRQRSSSPPATPPTRHLLHLQQLWGESRLMRTRSGAVWAHSKPAGNTFGEGTDRFGDTFVDRLGPRSAVTVGLIGGLPDHQHGTYDPAPLRRICPPTQMASTGLCTGSSAVHLGGPELSTKAGWSR
jgi:hypothetical protein